MKPSPGSTLQSLYAQLYPIEERKRRAALAVRFVLFFWFAAGIYNYFVAFALRFPEPTRRVLVAAGFGLIGPAVVHLPLPPRFATSGLEIGSRVAAGLLLLLVARLLHPPATIQTEIQDQAQRHAATQGREHPAQIARRLASQAPGVPLVRVGRQLIGVPYSADLGHIAIIAPTRSGKGLHLTQTLLTWPGAAVVVDPKGEQWQRTASWRASNIGPVYCLPPAGIDLLDYFNLGDPLDTQELHQHLIRPWQDKDPVFAEKCLALFTAAAQVGAATDTHALRVLAEWTDQRAPIALQAAYPHARAAIDRFVDGDDPGRPNRFALTAWGIFSSHIGPLVPHLDTWTTATVPHDWVVRRTTIYLCYPPPAAHGGWSARQCAAGGAAAWADGAATAPAHAVRDRRAAGGRAAQPHRVPGHSRECRGDGAVLRAGAGAPRSGGGGADAAGRPTVPADWAAARPAADLRAPAATHASHRSARHASATGRVSGDTEVGGSGERGMMHMERSLPAED